MTIFRAGLRAVILAAATVFILAVLAVAGLAAWVFGQDEHSR